MSELTEKEIDAFDGLNESYIEMQSKIDAIAPKCHFTTMAIEYGDNHEFPETWWQCGYCGHTKEFK